MNLTRLALVVIVLIGSAAVARADGLPVDPKMDVSDPTCTTSSCPNPVGPNQGFQFTVVPNSPGSTVGGGVFMATNESATEGFNGQWNSLLFTFPTADISISCTSGAGATPHFFRLAHNQPKPMEPSQTSFTLIYALRDPAQAV